MTEEGRTKQQCKDYLKLKGIDWFWNLQGIGSYKGLPDIEILSLGKTIYVEFKAKDGELSEYQIKFQEMCKRNKVKYFIVRSLEDLIKILNYGKQ